MVHVDQLILDPCHQERAHWVRDELACQIGERVIDVGTDPIVSQQMTMGVSIACKYSDTDPIIVSNDKVAPLIIIHRSSIPNRKSLVIRKRNARLEDTHLVYCLYIGIYRDDTRSPGVSTLFLYLHLIEFETLFIFI